MLDTLLPLLECYPGASWMTLGDGGYGSDAYYLQSHGADATATSLTDATLQVAFSRGYIKKYQVQNAEALTVADGSFDFVMCKESYHHFPRPPIAFYEMWRVARRALVLIEPYDSGTKPLAFVKWLAKKLLRGEGNAQFEPSGNFLFKVSVREVEKMSTAIGGEAMAVKYFNDFFYPRAARDRHGQLSFGSLITQLGLMTQNTLCRMGLLGYGLTTTLVFKEAIEPQLRDALNRKGFKIIGLPKNPYMQKQI